MYVIFLKNSFDLKVLNNINMYNSANSFVTAIYNYFEFICTYEMLFEKIQGLKTHYNSL